MTLENGLEWKAPGAIVPSELTLSTFFTHYVGEKDMIEMPVKFGDNSPFRRVNSYHT